MTCRSLWNTTSEDLLCSDVLSEIDLMFAAKESENKDAECTFCSGEFSKDARGRNLY